MKTNVNQSEVDEPRLTGMQASNDPASPLANRDQLANFGSFTSSTFRLPRLILNNQSSVPQFVFEEDYGVQQFTLRRNQSSAWSALDDLANRTSPKRTKETDLSVIHEEN